MLNTMKLCNFRDCTTGQHEPCPHNAVDPCKVFRHAETGHWYDEATGSPVQQFRKEDGKLFDVQIWLESQIILAAFTWKPRQIVHEIARDKTLRTNKPTRPSARAPKFSGQELDAIADTFIRNKKDRKELVQDIKESGMELHGLIRMKKKWGDHPVLSQRITELQEHRDALREVQSDMDKGSAVARVHLRNDNEWTRRWQPKKGCWDDFVLMCEHDKMLFVIDQHGLKVNGQYHYLPSKDKKHFESALWAETHYGIVRTRWQRMTVPAEKIGASLRRYGKKNANGRRINARADQVRYAGTVNDLVKAMREMQISVFRIRDDDKLFAHYLENIAPSFSRR